MATVTAMFQFWLPGVPNKHDFVFGVYRAFELAASIQEGLLYPRLGMGLNFTYSAPLLEFYAPLASYFTVALHWLGLGFVEAHKGVFTASLFVGVVGAYGYARWLYCARLPALVACGAWVFVPYCLTNAYERGTAAESLALALVPWLFWSCYRQRPDRSWHLWIALS